MLSNDGSRFSKIRRDFSKQKLFFCMIRWNSMQFYHGFCLYSDQSLWNDVKDTTIDIEFHQIIQKPFFLTQIRNFENAHSLCHLRFFSFIRGICFSSFTSVFLSIFWVYKLLISSAKPQQVYMSDCYICNVSNRDERAIWRSWKRSNLNLNRVASLFRNLFFFFYLCIW